MAWLALQSIGVTHEALLDQRRYDSLQLVKTDSQLAIARNTMISQLRAYLTIGPNENPDTTYANIDSVKPVVWAQYAIKNVGQTPAYNVQYWMNCDVKPSNATIGQFDTSEKLPLMGPPMAPGDRAFPKNFKRMSWKDLLNIYARKLCFYVWGKITYTDAFGIRHCRDYMFRTTTDAAVARDREDLISKNEECLWNTEY